MNQLNAVDSTRYMDPELHKEIYSGWDLTKLEPGIACTFDPSHRKFPRQAMESLVGPERIWLPIEPNAKNSASRQEAIDFLTVCLTAAGIEDRIFFSIGPFKNLSENGGEARPEIRAFALSEETMGGLSPIRLTGHYVHEIAHILAGIRVGYSQKKNDTQFRRIGLGVETLDGQTKFPLFVEAVAAFLEHSYYLEHGVTTELGILKVAVSPDIQKGEEKKWLFVINSGGKRSNDGTLLDQLIVPLYTDPPSEEKFRISYESIIIPLITMAVQLYAQRPNEQLETTPLDDKNVMDTFMRNMIRGHIYAEPNILLKKIDSCFGEGTIRFLADIDPYKIIDQILLQKFFLGEGDDKRLILDAVKNGWKN